MLCRQTMAYRHTVLCRQAVKYSQTVICRQTVNVCLHTPSSIFGKDQKGAVTYRETVICRQAGSDMQVNNDI